MCIKDEFAGLDMGSLIGGPLSAAADASSQLTKIPRRNLLIKLSFNEKRKKHTAVSSYQKHSVNEDDSKNCGRI